MPRLSLTKIIIGIATVIVLWHLENILKTIAKIHEWFSESLSFMRDFPQGMQAAIAFYSILLVAVFVYKTVNK